MANYAGYSYAQRKARTRNQLRRRKFIEQKLMGLALIALTALIFWIASTGASFEDGDATMALLTAPMGLYLLFTRHIVIV